MPADGTEARTAPAGDPRFTNTHWSAVLAAGGDTSRAATALAELCQAYWFPLYAFVRRTGYSPDDAEDLTQEFFRRLVEKKWVVQADPAKGRFRSFLIASLRHLLANEWNREHRQKRGGAAQIVSFEAEEAEDRYRREPADTSTPDQLYETRWAETLLARVLDRVEADYRDHPLGFENLKVFLVDRKGAVRFAEAGARLGVTESALKSVVHKLRERYRRIFLEEIANTLGPGEDVEHEARSLLASLGR